VKKQLTTKARKTQRGEKNNRQASSLFENIIYRLSVLSAFVVGSI
jgi:hypothetical protein